MHLKSNITNVCLNGIMYVLLGLFGMFRDIIRYFHNFLQKCIYFLLLPLFLSFPDKNLWFSSQRRREGVVGDANDSISKHWVLCIVACPLSKSWQVCLQNASIASSNKNSNLKVLIAPKQFTLVRS